MLARATRLEDQALDTTNGSCSMARITRTYTVDQAGLDTLREPRSGVVDEVCVAPDRWASNHGPTRSYDRELALEPIETDRFRATERITYSLATPLWWLLLTVPFRRAVARRDPVTLASPSKQPWWAPPDRLGARQAEILSLLAICTLVSTYLGTLLSQTLTFAAAEFGASGRAQGSLLALVRLSVVATLGASVVADRAGRRRVLVVSLLVACTAMATTVAAPSLAWFGASQTVGRGFSAAADLVILIVAAEEMPAGCRAYAASVLALVGGLGSGMVVWLLPLADQAVWGWRLLYIPPILLVPLAWWASRQVPESTRFSQAPHPEHTTSSHAVHLPPGFVRRLLLLGSGAFLLASFAAPASQFQNEFLRVQRGFSGARIAVFTLITSTPAGLGVFAGGRLADVYGRRRVGAVGIVLGVGFSALSYQTRGWPLWALSLIGTIGGAMTVPALRVYGPELFPTRLRARANGVMTLIAVAGSSCGLLLTGFLLERTGNLNWAFRLLAIGPLIVAVLVVTVYPETAHRTLEDLNPSDGPAPRA